MNTTNKTASIKNTIRSCALLMGQLASDIMDARDAGDEELAGDLTADLKSLQAAQAANRAELAAAVSQAHAATWAGLE